MYGASFLINVYIYINTVVVWGRNNEKHRGKILVMSLVIVQFRVLCVFFKDSFKIMEKKT